MDRLDIAIRKAVLAERQACADLLLAESMAAQKLGLTECASILDTLALRILHRDDESPKGA